MSIWVPIISTIGGAIVGWLLGFWGTLKVEQHKRKQLGKDFKEGLCAELKESLTQLVANYYLVNRTIGNINREMLEWVASMGVGTNGKLSEWSKEIEKWLKLSGNEVAALSSQVKASEFTPISLRKFNLSFLKENISSFSLLEPDFRRSVLVIRTNIGYLNEVIADRNFYFEKTFDSALTPENRSNLDINIKMAFELIAKLSRKLAEEIKKLIL
ncbi:hypothetical protein KAW50_03255 [candidate division WOR-3 bacterium]|nr:hypothetical protein [candidate division WOR-3 bacterium]